MKPVLRVGTRGSLLALTQTKQVVESLKGIAPDVRCDIVPIKTRGDRMSETGASLLEGKSVFTKEIEESLLTGQVDVAIHSMKDLMVDLPPGITIAAVPKRVNARDVLISRDERKLQQLQAHARVGTSSPRRKAQLLSARSDLEVLDMHGNIDTRLQKLKKGEFDAIVVAAAGLIRLDLEKAVTEFLSPDVMLPAVGQGALAIQTRNDDDKVISLVSRIDDTPSRRATEAERAFAKKLGADCRTPIAAYARFEGGKLAIDGMVAAVSGQMILRNRIVSDNTNASALGEELAQSMIQKGAKTILEAE